MVEHYTMTQECLRRGCQDFPKAQVVRGQRSGDRPKRLRQQCAVHEKADLRLARKNDGDSNKLGLFRRKRNAENFFNM